VSLDVELEPAQPEEIVHAVAALLADDAGAPDPWWRAGLNEILEDDA
jgi:hypothetical protein